MKHNVQIFKLVFDSVASSWALGVTELMQYPGRHQAEDRHDERRPRAGQQRDVAAGADAIRLPYPRYNRHALRTDGRIQSVLCAPKYRGWRMHALFLPVYVDVDQSIFLLCAAECDHSQGSVM